MDINTISIQLASSDPQRLLAFYRDTLKLTPQPEMGDALALGPAGTLFVVDHSEVSGAVKEPARKIIDLHVADIDAEQSRLESAGVSFSRSKGVEYWGGVISTFADPDGNLVKGVSFIRRKGHEPWGGRVSTLLDPDGNYVQLVEYHPGGMA